MDGKVWDLPHNEDFRHSLINFYACQEGMVQQSWLVNCQTAKTTSKVLALAYKVCLGPLVKNN